MAFNRIQARRLLAANELEVFEASLGETLAAATAPQLRSLIKRARGQRDKAVDLLRRQRVATQHRTGHKSGATGSDNERTAQKVQAMSEALVRLEKRLAQLGAAVERAAAATLRARERLAAEKQRAKLRRTTTPAKAARKATVQPQAKPRGAVGPPTAGAPAARSRKAPAVAPKTGAVGLPAASAGAMAAAAGRQRQFTGSQAIQAHVGARGRRQQARRDRKP